MCRLFRQQAFVTAAPPRPVRPVGRETQVCETLQRVCHCPRSRSMNHNTATNDRDQVKYRLFQQSTSYNMHPHQIIIGRNTRLFSLTGSLYSDLEKSLLVLWSSGIL